MLTAFLTACSTAIDFDEHGYTLPTPIPTLTGVVSSGGSLMITNFDEVKESLRDEGLITVEGKIYHYTWDGGQILGLGLVQYSLRDE